MCPFLLCSPERHAEALQQGSRFVVVLSRRYNRYIHSFLLIDLRVIDLWEDQLIPKAERVVAASIKRFRRNSAEVANARQHHVDQTIQELVHAVATKRNHCADWLAFTHFESSDRLLGLRDHRLLSGNLAKLGHSWIEDLGILRSFTDAHVHNDLMQTRNRHRVLQLKLLLECRRNVLV